MEPNSGEELRALKRQVQELRDEHDIAANRFRQNQALGDIFVGIGVRWLDTVGVIDK